MMQQPPTTEQQQQQQPTDQAALLRNLNQVFGGRAARRKAYRRYLKANRVPKPLFQKISDTRAFVLANMLTFLEDIRKYMAANK